MPEPNRVLVAGDWHANTAWAVQVIRRLRELLPDESPRVVLHCGDFGAWPGTFGRRYLREVGRALTEADAVLWFVDGNHEGHPLLAAASRIEVGPEAGLGRISERIFHLPRGHRWSWHDRTWLALGGGVSLNRIALTYGFDWWPEEEISIPQAHAAISGGRSDVMLTHDCPGSVVHTFPDRPDWWHQSDLRRCEDHRWLLQRVVDSVQPSWLIHGHLHRAYTRPVTMGHGKVQVTGLDCDGADFGNYAILNLATMEWEDAPNTNG